MYKLWEKITVTEVIEGKWEWRSRKLKKPLKWIIVGLRTLFKWNTEYEDGAVRFSQTSSVRAIMVSYDLKRKPIFVKTISTKKFEILDAQKNELQKKYPKQPIFIDVKEEKLYIILENWEKDYIF